MHDSSGRLVSDWDLNGLGVGGVGHETTAMNRREFLDLEPLLRMRIESHTPRVVVVIVESLMACFFFAPERE
jgi:hypothetical protein